MKQISVMIPPTLSIVMPFFNHEELVAEMIDSIRANDYQDWELLAIDDGSTPEAAAFLSQRYQADERIRFIPRSREPKGAQTCRNMGLEMARGEYIIFFDSDDYVAPYCLRQRVEAMENSPDLDFMVFPSGSYSNEGFAYNGTNIYGYPIYHDDLKAFLRRTLPFIVWSNIYRTKTLREKKLFWDTNLLSYQDSDYNIQAILHGLKYGYAKTKPDYGYRMVENNGSISKKITSEAHRKSHIYFLNKQYEETRRCYGKKYDKVLYQCALYIYSVMMAEGIDVGYARQIAGVVIRYDTLRGRLLFFKIWASRVLGTVLPSKPSRQLPMVPYLIRRWWQSKATSRRINNILKNKE